jgi:hypothetical protein
MLRCWFVLRGNIVIVCGASATYVDLAAAFFVEEDFKIRDNRTSLLRSAISLLANRDI